MFGNIAEDRVGTEYSRLTAFMNDKGTAICTPNGAVVDMVNRP